MNSFKDYLKGLLINKKKLIKNRLSNHWTILPLSEFDGLAVVADCKAIWSYLYTALHCGIDELNVIFDSENIHASPLFNLDKLPVEEQKEFIKCVLHIVISSYNLFDNDERLDLDRWLKYIVLTKPYTTKGVKMYFDMLPKVTIERVIELEYAIVEAMAQIWLYQVQDIDVKDEVYFNALKNKSNITLGDYLHLQMHNKYLHKSQLEAINKRLGNGKTSR